MLIGVSNKIKFNQLPDTFEQFLEWLLKRFQVRNIDKPLVVCLDYHYSTHTLDVCIGPLYPTSMFRSKFKRLYLYYSPSLKRFEIPFSVRNRNLYKKRLELHYQLAKMAVEQWK